MSRRAERALLGLALLLPPCTAAAQGVFPDRIPVRPGSRLPVEAREAVAVTLHLRAGHDPAAFEIGPEPVLPGEPSPRHRAPTFVVDFEEPPVTALAAAESLARGKLTLIADLVAITHRIVRPTRGWGWQIASEVARRREGDCTEHAVLLTALARHAGWPARIVLGVALVDDGKQVAALGHAWSEIHDGRSWILADATRLAEGPGRIRYLPLATLEDEGPGFAEYLLGATVAGWPVEIEFHPAGVRTDRGTPPRP